MTSKLARGVIHGRTIELAEDLGLGERQEVEVRVTIVAAAGPWGESLLRSAGALADDPHWDEIMEELHRARTLERRPRMEEG
jgi:citrate lyase beta subunit